MPRHRTEDKAEVMAKVCELVALGQTMRQVEKAVGIPMGTILLWVSQEPFTEQYTRARELASDIFETDIIEAAQSVSPETAAADRVKIDALKWVAARRAPKKYGDRLELDGKLNMPTVVIKDFTGRQNDPADD